MKRFALMLSALLLAVGLSAAPKTYELASPDGGLRVSISAGDGISYTLTSGEDVLLENSAIGMFTTDGQVFGGVQPVSKAVRKTDAEYNEITLKFKKFSVVFRAYDEGMAYRFISNLKAPFKVEQEMARFAFPQDWNMWAAYVTQHTETLESQFYNSFENRYSYTPVSEWN